MFQDDHILALMWTKIGGDLIWHMDEKAPLSSQNSDIYYDWRSLNETWRQFSLRLFSGLLSVNPWWKKNGLLAACQQEIETFFWKISTISDLI